MNEQFLSTPEWQVEENHKRYLHEKIQKWGDQVAPLFETMLPDEKETKSKFFEMLVESVKNGDQDTAYIVSGLYDQAYEACSHGDAFDEIKGIRINPNHHPFFGQMMQQQFNRLYNFYYKNRT